MLRVLAILLSLSSAIYATNLTGTLTGPDGTGVNGILFLSLAQQAALKSTGGCGGPVEVVPGQGSAVNAYSVRITVIAGVMQGSPHVYGNDCLLPGGTYYNVAVMDNNGNTLFTDKWLLSGASVDVGTIVSLVISGTTQTLGSTGYIMSVPSGNQTIAQPAGTSLSINVLGVTTSLTLPDGSVCTVGGCPTLTGNTVTLTTNQTISGQKIFQGILTVTGTGIVSPLFNCTNTGAANCLQQASGTFHITGAGDGLFQNLLLNQSETINGNLSVNGGSINVASTGDAVLTIHGSGLAGAAAGLFMGNNGLNCWNWQANGSGSNYVLGYAANCTSAYSLITEITVAPASVTFAQPIVVPGCSGCAGSVLLITNAGTTGTVLNKLAKLTGAPSTAVIPGTSDTSGVVGVTTGSAGTVGTATITLLGSVSCVFDGATTAGHYVQISFGTAGDCHDAGSSYPGSGQVIGRVLSTNGGGGTYTIDLYPSEMQAGGGGGGAVTSFNTRTGAITLTATDVTNAGANGTFGIVSAGDAALTIAGSGLSGAASALFSGNAGLNCWNWQANGSGSNYVLGYTSNCTSTYSLTTEVTIGPAGVTFAQPINVPGCTGCGTGSVTSFNTRTGAVTLTSGDVTGACTTCTITVASGATAMATAAIASGSCATTVTATATGGATTDNLVADFNADPTSTTGYSPTSSGMLTIIKWVTTNTANFKVCNNTASSITPGGITLNWRIPR